jgi:hypothetical protein
VRCVSEGGTGELAACSPRRTPPPRWPRARHAGRARPFPPAA